MCTSSTKIDLKALSPAIGESSYIVPNAINMHVSMPCPLKVPFQQIFTPFVEKYNSKHPHLPIFCPHISDCGSIDIEMMLQTAKNENDLPDLIVTTNYKILFSNQFYDRFIKTGIYKGVIKESVKEVMTDSIKNNLVNSNIGVLCFSSWSIIQDLTVEGVLTDITSWVDLFSTEREGQITVHGHTDRATFGLAYFLQQTFGKEALIQYARNIADIKHFSQIIKRMGSSDKYKTPFNLLPDVAASKIPSTKKVKALNLKEGKVLSPMVLMVKSSKIDLCQDILEMFWSNRFKAMLRDSGCIMPDELDKNTAYSIPDFVTLASDYDNIESGLDKLYLDNLPMNKIEERAVEGGVCK